MKFSQLARFTKKSIVTALVLGQVVPANVLASAPSVGELPIAAVQQVIGSDYRNLNLTPAATNEAMRFTWHSGSAEGAIRIWPAGQPEDARTVQSSDTRAHNTRTAGSGSLAGEANWWFDNDYLYFVHQLEVAGLTAAASYEYVVLFDGGESEVKSFRTGGTDTFSFGIAGDPQLGVGQQNANIDGQGWQNTLEIASVNHDLDFLLAVGDQIHTRNNQVQQSQFNHDWLFSAPQLASLPLMPVVGNHDGSGAQNSNAQLWHAHYNTPAPAGVGEINGNIRRHNNALPTQFDYWTRWGNVMFIVLDSNTQTMPAARLQFIEDAVAANQDADWLVAAFHHPAYSAYRFYAGDAARRNIISNWLPHFERLGVDIMLSGHDHAYSRSHVMLGNVPQRDQLWLDGDANIVNDPTGLHYHAVLNPTGLISIAFNSSSGSGYYTIRQAPRAYLAVSNQNFRRNYSVATVTPETFSVSTYQLNDDGTTALVDVFTIVQNETDTVPEAVVSTRTMDSSDLLRLTQPGDVDGIETSVTAEQLAAALPQAIGIETVISNNVGGNTGTIRNGDGHFGNLATHGTGQAPLTAPIAWDIEGSSFIPSHDEAQRFEVTGTVALPEGIGNPYDVDLAVTVTVTTGFYVNNEWTGYISYFGARYRFYGRSNPEFKYAAFDPAVFSGWTGGGAHPQGMLTPIGFGNPRTSGYTLQDGLNMTQGDPGARGGHTLPTGPGAHQRGTLGANGNAGLHTFTYFSRTFYLPEDFTPEQIGEVAGTHRIDDNLLLFINGVEIYRGNTATNASGNIRIGQPINWNTYVGHNTDAQNRSFHLNWDFEHQDSGYANQANIATRWHHAASRTNLVSALQAGQNVLTAVVGQNSATSSDLWFDLELYMEILPVVEEDTDERTTLASMTHSAVTATANNADIPANSYFPATGGLLQNSMTLRAVNHNERVLIGFAGTNRTPIVFNNGSLQGDLGWQAAHAAGVDNASAFEIRFETTGFENITFTADQKSTGSGPDAFKLAYRLPNQDSFTVIPDSGLQPVRVSNDTFEALQRSYDQFLLPETIANQPVVYLRVVYNGTISNRNGNTSINNILIQGAEMEIDHELIAARDALEALIAEVAALTAEDFTASSWQAVAEALSIASEALTSDDAAVILAAHEALAYAVGALEEAVEIYVASVTASARVNQLNGNTNDLYITIYETLSDDSVLKTTQRFNIRNNAADTYTIETSHGNYRVFVNTQGNTQIREIRIVE